MLKYRGIVAILSLVICLVNCSGGNQSTVTNSDYTNTLTNAITIDNAGVIPVLNNNSTTTTIYVRNNSNIQISGITYNAQINTNQTQNFIDPASAGVCKRINPHQSCPLTITTPTLGTASQGSALITASYNINNKATSFSNVISFAQVYNNQTNGAIINSSVTLNGFGNPNAYATTYVYGSGSGNIYNVSSIKTDKPAVSIVNGNISEQQIQSNYVQAVEITSPVATSGITSRLTVNSSMNENNYTSSVSVGVSPVSNGALLTTGQVPLIDSSTNNPGGTLYITNSGNESTTIGAITADTGISLTESGTCNSGMSLASGGSCDVVFTVSQAGGSGNISINYSNASNSSSPVLQNITWYNGIGTALVQMSASPNPAVFNATQETTTLVTITNIGGYSLTDVEIPTPIVVGGSAGTSMFDNTCSSILGLPVGGSCSYELMVHDSVTEQGQIILNMTGNYTNTTGTAIYSRQMVLNYTVNAYAAVLVLTPNPANTMTTTSNGNESAVQTLILSNNGAADANNVTQTGLSNNPSYLTSPSNTCSSSLKSGESCTITLNLGPTSTSTLESGSATYTVTYDGDGQTALETTATDSIPWVVQPSSTSIIIDSVTVPTATSGNGESTSSPYILSGYTTSAQTATLTIENNGGEAFTITGVQDNNSIYAWRLESDPTISTCYQGYSGTSLAPNTTCNLVYTNVLSQNASLISGGVGSSFNENLIVPVLTFSSSTLQYQVQPSLPTPYTGTTLYITGQQAIITNSVIVSGHGSYSESVSVTSLLANATGYSSLSLITTMQDYFSGTSSISSNCMTNSTNSITTQTCNLSPSAPSSSITYTVNTSLFQTESAILNSLFSLSSSGQTVSMSQLAVINTLSQIAWTWESGANFTGQAGNYTTGGFPGARDYSMHWTDESRNLWLFGGSSGGIAAYNDLWKYNTTTKLWTWISGSSFANTPGNYSAGVGNPGGFPGARYDGASWTDKNNNLWLFGGINPNGTLFFNDLWKYNISTQLWTWESGESSTTTQVGNYTAGIGNPGGYPGGRKGSMSWTDQNSNLWLFAGTSNNSAATGLFNDLWQYNTTTKVWTWKAGESSHEQPGNYVAIGQTGYPGSRWDGATWVDESGNFWLFGGFGCTTTCTSATYGKLNDLWKYNVTANTWTWVAGSNSINQLGNYSLIGSSGYPGGRNGSAAWTDQQGNFWLFGGQESSTTNNLNDLWQYNVNLNTWVWQAGASVANQIGIYGILGVANGYPGSRLGSVGWVDANGNMWLFGGDGYASTSTAGYLNDLWQFKP